MSSEHYTNTLEFDPRLPLPVVLDNAEIGWTRREIMEMTSEAGEGQTILRRVGLSVENEAGDPVSWEGMDLKGLLDVGDKTLELYAQTCSRHRGEVKVVEHKYALARTWPQELRYSMHPLLQDLEGGMALVAAVKVVKHAHRLRAQGIQAIAEGLWDYKQLDPDVSIRDITAEHFVQKNIGRRKFLVDIDLPLVFSGK